ncbi:hypothetical protein [Flammeovirga agarivorans]|uniref:Uncharacterized protein n=1 Tax=Flammeovirga agarivorans TaxID=2726742 RepID=A0A7X8SIJ4_9BACT|nr:hypothetical protein [Flammeovirga agarivorans]NLR90757.1 hypothetical protein [Flammeovirga agarivorans]
MESQKEVIKNVLLIRNVDYRDHERILNIDNLSKKKVIYHVLEEFNLPPEDIYITELLDCLEMEISLHSKNTQ